MALDKGVAIYAGTFDRVLFLHQIVQCGSYRFFYVGSDFFIRTVAGSVAEQHNRAVQTGKRFF